MSGAAATLVEALERAAGAGRGGLRLLDRREDEQWRDWSEIHRRAVAFAGALQALDVVPGDRLALVLPTSWGFFDAFFGTLLAGAVPVPLYPPVRLGRLDEYHAMTARMVERSGARMILTDTRVGRLLGETTRRSRPPLGCRNVEELPRARATVEVAPAPDDLALVQFSSGTTMDPRPVALTHRAVMWQVEALNRFWPDDALTRHSGVSWLPLYHDMGLIGCVFPALERPAELNLIPPELFVARPAVWLRAISRHRATISPAPNFAYGLCVEKVRDEEMEGVDLSSWRVALNGAETVSPPTMRAFRERFGRWGLRPETLTPVYGLSEAALAVTFSDLDREFRALAVRRDRLGAGDRVENDPEGLELASVGRPLPGVEVELRRDDGSVSAEREVGRIWVCGPSLMEGYLGMPEASARALRNGWLDTGDLGFRVDGELYIAGRDKDLVIVRGRNYAPEQLERAVDSLPGARRGCSVAVSTRLEQPAAGGSGSSATESVLLFVERHRRASPAEVEALPRRCEEAVLAAAGIEPDGVFVLPPGTLPRTSSGKMRRAEALRRHLAGELQPPERVGWWFMLRELARSKLAQRRGGEGATDDAG